MKKFLIAISLSVILLFNTVALAYGEDFLTNVYVNMNNVQFAFTPFIRDGVTYVDLQTLAKSFGFKYTEFQSHGSITVYSTNTSVCFSESSDYATVSDLTGTSLYEYVFYKLSAQCFFSGDSLAVPVRDFAEIFDIVLGFDNNSLAVYLGELPITRTQQQKASPVVTTPIKESVSAQNHTYYFQNQEEFALPGFGSGYCWATSYAMLLTDVLKKKVTPNDVAEVNLKHTASGAHCYHGDIVSTFGAKFVSAIPEASPYFGGRDVISGGTLINNPDKSDEIAVAALQEALTLHPEGVIVRYASYPHTMVAVGFEGDTILFNDPAPTSSSSYSSVGKYNGVEFEKTCVGRKGIEFSSMNFIQAVSPQ